MPSPSGRTRIRSQRAGLPLSAGDADLLLQPAAFARRLEQAIDRFRHVGIADEDALDRPHVVCVAGVDQREIGGIGIDHPAALVGDQEAVDGLVDHRLEHRIAGVLAGMRRMPVASANSENTPTVARKREQRQDIRAGIAAADQQQPDRGADQRDRHQQHHADAAAARAGWLRSTAGGR